VITNALLLAALATACPAALDPEAGPADLRAQARAAVAELERRGPADAVAAEADGLARAAKDPALPRGEVRARATRFAARLERHCQLLAQRPIAGASAADRSRLGDILARPEFRGSRPATFALGRWLAKIWDDILELLGTAEAGRYAAGGRNVFFGLLATGVLAALFLVLRRRAATRRRGAPGPAEPGTHRLPDPAESDSRASAALHAGDATEAVRQAFLGLLGALERGRRVPAGRALTNRELAAWLASPATATTTPTATTTATEVPVPPTVPPSELALAFAALARTFDRAVYGMAPPALAEAEGYLERSRALRRLLAEGWA
jgi:hypothetical protein